MGRTRGADSAKPHGDGGETCPGRFVGCVHCRIGGAGLVACIADGAAQAGFSSESAESKA
jgi:hypothetical protein